jgi:hypothetical protein
VETTRMLFSKEVVDAQTKKDKKKFDRCNDPKFAANDWCHWTPSNDDKIEFYQTAEQEKQCEGFKLDEKSRKPAVLQAALGKRCEMQNNLYVGRIDKNSNDPVAKVMEHPDGLFTLGGLKKGEILLAYTGEVNIEGKCGEEEERQLYQFQNGEFVIDGKIYRNQFAFANDFRSNALDPEMPQDISRQENVIFMRVRVGSVEMVVGVVIKDVSAGGQVLVGYGQTYWDQARIVHANQKEKEQREQVISRLEKQLAEQEANKSIDKECISELAKKIRKLSEEHERESKVSEQRQRKQAEEVRELRRK